jgi:hypothetical protein
VSDWKWEQGATEIQLVSTGYLFHSTCAVVSRLLSVSLAKSIVFKLEKESLNSRSTSLPVIVCVFPDHISQILTRLEFS